MSDDDDDRAMTLRMCRGCFCTDDHACEAGCYWVLLDIHMPSGICSTCADAMQWHPTLFMIDELDVENVEQWVGAKATRT
jgi:hypothetical protein